MYKEERISCKTSQLILSSYGNKFNPNSFKKAQVGSNFFVAHSIMDIFKTLFYTVINRTNISISNYIFYSKNTWRQLWNYY